MTMRLASILLLLFALSACEARNTYVSEDKPQDGVSPLELVNTGEDTSVIEPVDSDPQSAVELENFSQTSYSSECTQDCSGHDAGYAWAEENSIEDPADCGGNSQSFIEGWESYAKEQQSEQEDGQENEDQ